MCVCVIVYGLRASGRQIGPCATFYGNVHPVLQHLPRCLMMSYFSTPSSLPSPSSSQEQQLIPAVSALPHVQPC